MVYKCYVCSEGFRSSAALIQHMNTSHSGDVAHAEYKIDQTRPDEPSTSSAGKRPGALCPYCRKDCSSSRQLRTHLELEHLEEDKEDEPKLKLIKLPQTSQSVIDKLNNGQGGLSLTSDPRLVQHLLSVFQQNRIQEHEIDRVASGEVKLPEKKYTCFWCDATFRKRGKLMDHIDMFHKANKQQTAAQADRIQNSGNPVSNVVQPSSAIFRQNSLPNMDSMSPPTVALIAPTAKAVSKSMGGAPLRKLLSHSKPVSCTPASAPKMTPLRTNVKSYQLHPVEATKPQFPPKIPKLVSTKPNIGSRELSRNPTCGKVCVFTLAGVCRKRRARTNRYDEPLSDNCKFIYKQQPETLSSERNCPAVDKESVLPDKSISTKSYEELNHESASQQQDNHLETTRRDDHLETNRRDDHLETTRCDLEATYPITYQIAPMLLPFPCMKEQTVPNYQQNFSASSAQDMMSTELHYRDFNMGLLYPQLLLKSPTRSLSTSSTYSASRTELRNEMQDRTDNIYRNPDAPLDLSMRL